MALFSTDSKVRALKQAPLFAGLSKKELVALAKATEDMEFETGTVLCKQGAIGSEFFVIVEGEVEVTQGGKKLRTAGGGDFFGEIALIESVRRTATVTTTTPVRAFVLTKRSFGRLLENSPQVERKVLRALAKRVAALAGDPASV